MSMNADCTGAKSGAITKFAVAAGADARRDHTCQRPLARACSRSAQHGRRAGSPRPFSEWVMGMGHAAGAEGPGCPIMGRPNGEPKAGNTCACGGQNPPAKGVWFCGGHMLAAPVSRFGGTRSKLRRRARQFSFKLHRGNIHKPLRTRDGVKTPKLAEQRHRPKISSSIPK